MQSRSGFVVRAIAYMFLPAIVLPIWQSSTLAQISAAPDGTNTNVVQSGNTFNITNGTQAGSNQFHSFQQFGLNQGQVANFLSNPAIQNILGRVTGGDASVINGRIQVTGSNANLYLMNPAGIVFGANATLNVPGSFAATTANGIGMGNGWFNATGNNNYAALTGAPNQFAFTSAQPGAIINAGNLTVGPGQSVTLLGGTVINTGTIATSGGIVTIAAVPGEKLVRVTQSGSLLSLDLPTATRDALNPNTITPASLPALLTGGNLGQVTGLTVDNGIVKLVGSGKAVLSQPGDVTVSQRVDVAGTRGGTVQLLGDRVHVTGATVDASGQLGGGTVLIGGDLQGQGTLPTARRTVVSADSSIDASAKQQGKGGRVIVWADEATGFYGRVAAKGGTNSGNGGFVEVSGKQSLTFEGSVDVTAPKGTNGQLLLDPDVVLIGALGTDDAQLDDGQILAGDGGAVTFNISTTKLVQMLNSGNVAIAANNAISVLQPVNSTANPNPGNLSLTAPTISANAPIALKGNLTLNGSVTNTDNRVIDLSTTGNLVIQGPVFVNDAIGVPARVRLTSTQGNIIVQTISSGAGGVDINAAGLFQARGGADRVNVFLRARPETDPELNSFFQSKGITLASGQFATVHYEFGNPGESLPVVYSIAAAQSDDVPAGALNAPVTIRYGGATRTLIDSQFPIISTDGTSTVTQGRILIQGGDGAFFLGPTVTGRLVPGINDAFVTKDATGNFVPVDPATYNPATILYRNQTYQANFPTADFPANISGLAGSIYVGFGSNTTLYGATQNRVFGAVPPVAATPGGSSSTTSSSASNSTQLANQSQIGTVAGDAVQRTFERGGQALACIPPTEATGQETIRSASNVGQPCVAATDEQQILKILEEDDKPR